MNSTFDSTIPFGAPELMRASAYRLYLKELEEEAALNGTSSRIASLSPSLRADLYRFEGEDGHPESLEALEVVAACVRHARRVTIHLLYDERVVPLTVFPEERLVHCPVPWAEPAHGAGAWAGWRERARQAADPGDAGTGRETADAGFATRSGTGRSRRRA